MRLINVYSLEIERFKEATASYAVLSHRWGDDGNEVEFTDYPSAKSQIVAQISQGQTDNPTTGIAKIAKACLQCRQLKLKYLWVDTCCINKQSSSEESESINSMFNWYSEAKVCLTYLADVGEAHKAFTASDWFKRGWTLQELLASRDVTFFDRDWKMIGTKASLSSEIEKATRISHNHMLDFRSASIATKMSWQAGRSTTRSEDIAYSMFGIFDVGMDIRYGERENAFRRLQEEIINRNPLDESILAWTSTEPGSGVLAPNPACFKSCADLIVRSPTHKYRGREAYRISNRGLEITVTMGSTAKIAAASLVTTNVNWAKRLETVDVTLNCWKAGKPSPSTVVITLDRDGTGFYRRTTNRDRLAWANEVSRNKPLSSFMSLAKPATATTISVQL